MQAVRRGAAVRHPTALERVQGPRAGLLRLLGGRAHLLGEAAHGNVVHVGEKGREVRAGRQRKRQGAAHVGEPVLGVGRGARGGVGHHEHGKHRLEPLEPARRATREAPPDLEDPAARLAHLQPHSREARDARRHEPGPVHHRPRQPQAEHAGVQDLCDRCVGGDGVGPGERRCVRHALHLRGSRGHPARRGRRKDERHAQQQRDRHRDRGERPLVVPERREHGHAARRAATAAIPTSRPSHRSLPRSSPRAGSPSSQPAGQPSRHATFRALPRARR